MGWKFNPPPGWQVPPGWTPPQGWTADPTWPPAPQGWQFWTADEGPATQGAPTAAWYKQWWVIALAAVLLVLCLCGGIAGLTALARLSDKPKPSPTGYVLPWPSNLPQPSSRPSPSPLPSPSPTPEVVPPAADISFAGTGSKVVKLQLSPDRRHIATIKYQGQGNFIINALDAQGESRDLVVNTIGVYSGVRPLDMSQTPSGLQIQAEGPWKIVVQDLSKAPMWTGNAKGHGPAVLQVPADMATGLTTMKITHNGRDNFFVHTYAPTYSDLLVNVIGRYSGEVRLPIETNVIAVDGDGDWSIVKS